MPLRFRGLVKAASDLEERVFAGLRRAEAPSFLQAARRIVERVGRRCLEKGATVADLPRPSRCAVARILALARLGPAEVVQIEHAGPSRRVRVTNVTASLARFLGILGREPGADVLGEALEAMSRSVERIERLCRGSGTTPGWLPERSAYAFAMMKWLAGWDIERLLPGPGRLGDYVEQVRLARGPLEEATARLWRDGPRRVDLAFVPGRHVWRVRPEDGVARWRLSTGWLRARRGDFEDLAAVASRRRHPPRAALARHRAFTESPTFREIDRELERLLAGDRYEPRGRFRDLAALFARVNRELFEGRLARPHLHWAARASRGRFGSYDRVRDVVCMNPVLDDPRVPEQVTAYVLYHELLHKSHGFRLAGTRRMAHTAEFAADERRFPGWETAALWLELLAGGWDGVPPGAAGKTPPRGACPGRSPA